MTGDHSDELEPLQNEDTNTILDEPLASLISQYITHFAVLKVEPLRLELGDLGELGQIMDDLVENLLVQFVIAERSGFCVG
jgi:ATP-dependent protease HslVU (ClpYQ), ATPase subunit